MQVKLICQLDFELFEDGSHNSDQIKKSVQEAVINALEKAESEGYNHPLSNDGSLSIESVSIVPVK